MRILPFLTEQVNNSAKTLIIHPGALSPELPLWKLPRVSPDVLGRLWRTLDDWPAGRGVAGISASRIAQLGLKVSLRTIVFKNSELVIPRHVPLIATRSVTGRITALSTPERWLTRPSIHTANLIRRHWLRQIEVFPSVLLAELAAHERNIAAVSMGGLDIKHLSQRITGECPRVVAEMERAA